MVKWEIARTFDVHAEKVVCHHAGFAIGSVCLLFTHESLDLVGCP